MRSSSSCSSMSDDSGMGPAQAASVQPRPHQWLYKEYKIQDEIGSGGFGRVCRCVCVCTHTVLKHHEML